MTEIKATVPARDVAIAIITSRFNGEVTSKLQEAAVKRLLGSGVNQENIVSVWVPGAVEMPLMAARCASSEMFDAVIVLGAVVQGETRHFDFVCQQVSEGCQAVALEHDTPVIFGVLTTNTMAQAMERAEQQRIGAEWADAALQMIAVSDELDELLSDDLDDDFSDLDELLSEKELN